MIKERFYVDFVVIDYLALGCCINLSAGGAFGGIFSGVGGLVGLIRHYAHNALTMVGGSAGLDLGAAQHWAC
jgi:hypothetical protein